MVNGLTLSQKLKDLFNRAAAQCPSGQAFLREISDRYQQSLSDPDFEKKAKDGFGYPVSGKWYLWKIDTVGATAEDADRMARVWYDAQRLIREHKGPRV